VFLCAYLSSIKDSTQEHNNQKTRTHTHDRLKNLHLCPDKEGGHIDRFWSDMSFSHESPYSSSIGTDPESPLVARRSFHTVSCDFPTTDIYLHCTGTSIRVIRMCCGTDPQMLCVKTRHQLARDPGVCACSRCARSLCVLCVRAHTHPHTGKPAVGAHAPRTDVC
jgi:hypothetical protein